MNHLFEKLKLHEHNHYYVLAGDLNSRHTIWGDRTTNKKGAMLKNWEMSTAAILYRTIILPPEAPTFPSANTFLDLGIVDGRLDIPDLSNRKIITAHYNSDHRAIVFTVKLPFNTESIDSNDTYRYTYKKTRWKQFSKKLSKNYNMDIPHNRNLAIEEIEAYLAATETLIKHTIAQTVPKYKPTDNILNYTNTKIKKLHKYKSFILTSLHRTYRHIHNNIPYHDTTFLKEVLAKINYLLKLEYAKSYTKYWDSLIKTIDYRKSDSFFPKINRFFRPKSQLKLDNITVQKEDENLLLRCNYQKEEFIFHNDKYYVQNPIDVLNIFGAYYEKINSPRYTNTSNPIKEIVEKDASRLINIFKNNLRSKTTITTFSETNSAINPDNTTNSLFCNPFHTRYICKYLPNKSSSGLDEIPPIILKHMPRNLIIAYRILFNNCINNRYFPESWKTAKVLPTPKSGNPPDEIPSYRPISLTPAISKVFEAIIQKSIIQHTTDNRIIPDTQFGFKHKHSTTHAVHKIINDITTNVHTNKIVGACLIDIEKAFDSIWIKGLIYILNDLNFPTDLIEIIWRMVTNRSFVTWNGNLFSTISYTVKEGLTQGTVNSPILFNIFTHNITNLFQLNTNNNTYSAAYADDLIILVADTHPNIVQNKLELLTIIFDKPLRFLNSSRRHYINNFSIAIQNNNNSYSIQHKKSIKYLGVHLDYLLKFDVHVTTQLQKATNTFRKYNRLFRPIITYAVPIWWNVNAATMEKIRKFERNCIRAALHIYRKTYNNHFINNKTLYTLADIPRIDNHILQLIRDYHASIPNTENDILIEIMNTNTTDMEESMISGYVTPQAFTHIDKIGLIQDEMNIPLIYHAARNRADKTFKYNHTTNPANIKYSTAIPDRDRNNFHRLLDKYWWLVEDGKFIDELRRRRRRRDEQGSAN
ncbi:uncharacterized protein LOC143363244 [Halictus rubicundus]|uniref:uncharacterized protein LOC143363244 n=1 Tax=Halictus rubicundus TaxID=77578 RepID=UPI0040358DA1